VRPRPQRRRAPRSPNPNPNPTLASRADSAARDDGEKGKANKQVVLYALPRVLLLHLKRFTHGLSAGTGKVHKPVRFEAALQCAAPRAPGGAAAAAARGCGRCMPAQPSPLLARLEAVKLCLLPRLATVIAAVSSTRGGGDRGLQALLHALFSLHVAWLRKAAYRAMRLPRSPSTPCQQTRKLTCLQRWLVRHARAAPVTIADALALTAPPCRAQHPAGVAAPRRGAPRRRRAGPNCDRVAPRPHARLGALHRRRAPGARPACRLGLGLRRGRSLPECLPGGAAVGGARLAAPPRLRRSAGRPAPVDAPQPLCAGAAAGMASGLGAGTDLGLGAVLAVHEGRRRLRRGVSCV